MQAPGFLKMGDYLLLRVANRGDVFGQLKHFDKDWFVLDIPYSCWKSNPRKQSTEGMLWENVISVAILDELQTKECLAWFTKTTEEREKGEEKDITNQAAELSRRLRGLDSPTE